MNRKTIITVAAILLMLALGLLGAAVSPRLDGDPLLLSPDLARATSYLRFVSARLDTLQQADKRLADVLSAGKDAPDLLEQARKARTATEDALAVAAAVDQEWTPPELESLKLALKQAALDYVEAGRQAVLFVNAPTDSQHTAAVQALSKARLSSKETNSRWTRLNPH